MTTNWLQKFCTRYRGYHTDNVMRRYMPERVGNPEEVYQSSDLPWVFLGGANRSELQQAEQLAGQPICARIDVTDADTGHMPGPLTQKIPFPEFETWNDQSYDNVRQMFNQTVDMVVRTISAKRCPVYIHCSAGANRSVSILAAAISRITGKSIFEVLREMKSKRGLVSPHDVYVMMAMENSTNPHDMTHKQQLRQDMTVEEHVPARMGLELKPASVLPVPVNDQSLPSTMPLKHLMMLADPNVPIDKLRATERPYLDNLKSKIQREGLQSPIEVLIRNGKPFRIWEGMHRLTVLDELNIDNVPVKYITLENKRVI